MGAPVVGASVVGAAEVLLGVCGGFVDPVVLAHVDAALAHELASRAAVSAMEAVAGVEQAVREGRPSGYLAGLVSHASAMKTAASKAATHAQSATAIITALGGTLPVPSDPTTRNPAPSTADPSPVPGIGVGFDVGVVEGVDGGVLIDVVARLEEVKNALTGIQIQAEALFSVQQRLVQVRAGMPVKSLGKGVGLQIGLARHESAHRGRQAGELASVVVRELPFTFRAVCSGKIGEYHARIIAMETVFLSAEHRGAIDRALALDPERLAAMGSKELAVAARRAAYLLEPEVFVQRREKAVSERHVSLRPAADGMTLLSALIPLRQGIQILSTLRRVSGSAKACADTRTQGQLMADALIHRLTHHQPCHPLINTPTQDQSTTHTQHGPDTNANDRFRASTDNRVGINANDRVRASTDSRVGTRSLTVPRHGAAATGRWEEEQIGREGSLCTSVTEPEITLELIMTDRALFHGANDPAILTGYEPIPAPEARHLITHTNPTQQNTTTDKGTKTGSGTDTDTGTEQSRGGSNTGTEHGKNNNNSTNNSTNNRSNNTGSAGGNGSGSPRVWVKRLYTHPDTGELLAMDSRARLFPEGMKEFLRQQYQHCATPYCDAPIREYDHIKSWATGGTTTITNGQGLCTA
ncbi:hypothetical protein, partial [Arthrobacter cryoconiti]